MEKENIIDHWEMGEVNNPEKSIETAINSLTDNISSTLIFGNEEKILTKEEMEQLIWKTFWIQQYGENCYCKITGMSSYNDQVSFDFAELPLPKIRGDEYELADVLKELWYNLTKLGRSWFASRNSYLISIWKEKDKKKLPLLILWRDNVVWTGTIYEWEVLSEQEFVETREWLEKAQEILANRRHNNILNYINQNKKWDISIISVWGSPDDFSFSDIPENFHIISQRRTARTQDHRRNMTHTYEVVLIDKNLFTWKKFIKIQVPNEYKGLVIGKWGSTIKNLSEKFNCTIQVK